MRTHNFYIYMKHWKASANERKKLTEKRIHQLLRTIFMISSPIYKFRIQKNSFVKNELALWAANDIKRQAQHYASQSLIFPLMHKELALLDGNVGSVFQPITHVTSSSCLNVTVTDKSLWNRKLWMADGWLKFYQPLSNVWRIKKATVTFESILEMHCSASIIASLTNRSESFIIRMRRCRGIDLSANLKARDRGPQLKLMERNNKSCFLIFLATTLFKYCTALGMPVEEAFYWAVSEVKATGFYPQCNKPGIKKGAREFFSFESNLFYWLCSLGLIVPSEKLKSRVKSMDEYPDALIAYYEGSNYLRMPNFSIWGMSFQINPFLPRDFVLFLMKVNECLRERLPLEPVFVDYQSGKFDV